MTCREKLKLEHPECVNNIYAGGCFGCPTEYGYLPASSHCDLVSLLVMSKEDEDDVCVKCWNKEALWDKEIEAIKIDILEGT